MQSILALSLLLPSVLSAPILGNLPSQCIRDGGRWCVSFGQPHGIRTIIAGLGPVLPNQHLKLWSTSKNIDIYTFPPDMHVDHEKRDEVQQEQGNANDESEEQQEEQIQQAEQEDEEKREKRDEVKQEQGNPNDESDEQAEDNDQPADQENEEDVQRRARTSIPTGAGDPSRRLAMRSLPSATLKLSAPIERRSLSKDIGAPWLPRGKRSIPIGADDP